MPICDILVSVDATAAGEVRLRLAFDIARRQKARLTAVYRMPPQRDTAPPIGLGPFPPGEAPPPPPVTPPPREPERADEAEAAFRTDLQASGLSGHWLLIDDRDLATFVDYANAADLTVLGQRSGERFEGGFRPDQVLLEVGRPVLIVPYAGHFPTVGRRPLLAWDGSREAARALSDALPLIAGAEEAILLYVAAQEADLERKRPSLDRMLQHLARHGVTARIEETPRGDIPISDLLLSRAADLDIDLLVTGAYHHSRLREALLGGVSRELLQHMTVPVLMAH